MADPLLAAVQARGAVGQVPLVLLAPDREAEVGPVGQAVHALPALGGEERDHVVTGRQAGHALAHLLDHARALVSEHRRRVARRVGAARRVHVRVADAAGGEPHQHLSRARVGSRSTSCTTSGSANSSNTAARIFMARGPYPQRPLCHRGRGHYQRTSCHSITP